MTKRASSSSGTITTSGANADGLVAQSLGGGGSNSRQTSAVSGLSFAGINVAVGGKGKAVTVISDGSIATVGELSTGLKDVSQGGGGGTAAMTISGTASFSASKATRCSPDDSRATMAPDGSAYASNALCQPLLRLQDGMVALGSGHRLTHVSRTARTSPLAPDICARSDRRKVTMALNILGKLFFGGSVSLEWLDQGLEAAGLSPSGFPEPLRLALVRLTKDAMGLPQRGEPKGAAAKPLIEALNRNGRLFAYCYQGHVGFQDREGSEQAESMQSRLQVAAEAPEGLDARVISLALLSGYAHPDIAALYEAEVEEEDKA